MTKSRTRAKGNAALGSGAGGGPRIPGCRLRPPAPVQVLPARIRPRQVRARRGGGRRRPTGRRQGAPFERKRSGPQEPLGSGAPPPAGWAGLPQRAAREDPGPPPASAAAGSGFDKLNLRALEKLQEEKSEECAEWLEAALSPRELRPPRARAGPSPPERAPGRRGRGRARTPLPRGSRAAHLPRPQPRPPPS